MSRTSEQRVCVVVLEAGGEWPDFVETDADHPISWAVIPQQPDETPAELGLRAQKRVEAIVHSGAALDTVVIAAGSHHNDQIFAARCGVARALIHVMSGTQGRRLVFSAPSTLPASARHDLIALAGTLAGQVRGTQLDVGVRFEEPHGRSPSRSRSRTIVKDSSAVA